MTVLGFGVALLLAGCPPQPVTPPGPIDAGLDAPALGDARSCAGPAACACQHLADLGCVEGRAANCASTIDAELASRLTFVDLDCIQAAADKPAVRQCAGVRGAGACP